MASIRFGLDGKRVIVTGGTKGIGVAIVRALLDEGASVITNYHENKSAAQTLVANVPTEHFPRLSAHMLDISSLDGANKLVLLAQAQLGGLDIVVNNAATLNGDEARDVFNFTDKDFDRVFHTNLRGLFYLTRAAMALMIDSGTGRRIVNMSSTGVYTGNPREALYASSKAGVEAATRMFAALGAKHEITVNAVAPHVIQAGMALEKSFQPETLSRIPLGRAGRAEEVAALVLFLCTEMSAFMTGTVVTMDGGRLVAR
jgi:3-oxoacyl-[acyl-carrier protein] reductase